MDTLFATGHLALWLFLAGLFFPRLALLVAWLEPGTYLRRRIIRRTKATQDGETTTTIEEEVS